MQLAAGASVVHPLWVMEKIGLLITTLATVSLANPQFVTVRDWAED